MTHHPPTVYAADMGALTLMLVSWWGLLPSIAAALAVVWYAIQIYDRFKS